MCISVCANVCVLCVCVRVFVNVSTFVNGCADARESMYTHAYVNHCVDLCGHSTSNSITPTYFNSSRKIISITTTTTTFKTSH
jgi:hypothetical protein